MEIAKLESTPTLAQTRKSEGSKVWLFGGDMFPTPGVRNMWPTVSYSMSTSLGKQGSPPTSNCFLEAPLILPDGQLQSPSWRRVTWKLSAKILLQSSSPASHSRIWCYRWATSVHTLDAQLTICKITATFLHLLDRHHVSAMRAHTVCACYGFHVSVAARTG